MTSAKAHTVFETSDWLESLGFRSNGRQIQPEKTSWYKDGVCVNRWDLVAYGKSFCSYDVEVTFETPMNLWANFKFYSLGQSELETNLSALLTEAKELQNRMELKRQ